MKHFFVLNFLLDFVHRLGVIKATFRSCFFLCFHVKERQTPNLLGPLYVQV
jgi:hypothetical protein